MLFFFMLLVTAVLMTRAALHMSRFCIVCSSRGAVPTILVISSGAQCLIVRLRRLHAGCRTVRNVRGFSFVFNTHMYSFLLFHGQLRCINKAAFFKTAGYLFQFNL